MHKINRLSKYIKKEEKQQGFTLIELLVVVAILGVLAGVAIPSVGKFINSGKDQAANTELHDVQTAVMALMAESSSGNVTGGTGVSTNDLDTITASNTQNATIHVSDYMVGLNLDGTTKTGKYYTVTPSGVVTQQ